jgi:NDP-sugar pyrophosphorylase family protein
MVNIINKPLLAYQLEFLERNKIKEVSIIVKEDYYREIASYIEAFEKY